MKQEEVLPGSDPSSIPPESKKPEEIPGDVSAILKPKGNSNINLLGEMRKGLLKDVADTNKAQSNIAKVLEEASNEAKDNPQMDGMLTPSEKLKRIAELKGGDCDGCVKEPIGSDTDNGKKRLSKV